MCAALTRRHPRHSLPPMAFTMRTRCAQPWKPLVHPTGWVWSGETLRAVYDALRNTGGTGALFRERPAMTEGESPEYTGRAVAHLAADPNVLEKSGRVLTVDVLAREYGFSDVDGRQPIFPRW